ncbi:hypothetical protein I3V78_24075 [Archangium primigenium]|nr:DUF6310 domain-containing protein [Archangium primigenium]MBM7116634.1 hypothetical protein [Archangium primigenium]
MVDPQPPQQQEPAPAPSAEDAGSERRPPVPLTSPPRPECIPVKRPHRGGDEFHNLCADRVPHNAFSGFDAFVNGKHFDALQLRSRVLWEVKTDNFETYSPFLRRKVIEEQVFELSHERELARLCGFDFRVGVRSTAHEKALKDADFDLSIIIMDWC